MLAVLSSLDVRKAPQVMSAATWTAPVSSAVTPVTSESDNLISLATPTTKARLWMPRRVVFTPAALDEEYGQRILARVRDLELPV